MPVSSCDPTSDPTVPSPGRRPAVGLKALGAALPRTVVTNHDLAGTMDTGDEWIRSRTGIVQRRIADADQSTGDLAVEAAGRALAGGDFDIGLVVLATASPDYLVPGTAPEVSDRLGLGRVPAFDVAAVCAGFVYALSLAVGMVRGGAARDVLVIAAEKFSSLVDPSDRNTAVLFGDGAGAVVVGVIEPGTPGEVLAHDLGADGSLRSLIQIEGGGARYPAKRTFNGTSPGRSPYLSMQGSPVFAAAVSAMTSSVASTLEQVRWSPGQVDWLIGHQANLRILNKISEISGIPVDRCVVHLDRVGNTSAASIPLAMASAYDRIRPGDRVLLTAFGGGATWGSLALTWPDITVTDPH